MNGNNNEDITTSTMESIIIVNSNNNNNNNNDSDKIVVVLDEKKIMNAFSILDSCIQDSCNNGTGGGGRKSIGDTGSTGSQDENNSNISSAGCSQSSTPSTSISRSNSSMSITSTTSSIKSKKPNLHVNTNFNNNNNGVGNGLMEPVTLVDNNSSILVVNNTNASSDNKDGGGGSGGSTTSSSVQSTTLMGMIDDSKTDSSGGGSPMTTPSNSSGRTVSPTSASGKQQPGLGLINHKKYDDMVSKEPSFFLSTPSIGSNRLRKSDGVLKVDMSEPMTPTTPSIFGSKPRSMTTIHKSSHSNHPSQTPKHEKKLTKFLGASKESLSEPFNTPTSATPTLFQLAAGLGFGDGTPWSLGGGSTNNSSPNSSPSSSPSGSPPSSPTISSSVAALTLVPNGWVSGESPARRLIKHRSATTSSYSESMSRYSNHVINFSNPGGASFDQSRTPSSPTSSSGRDKKGKMIIAKLLAKNSQSPQPNPTTALNLNLSGLIGPPLKKSSSSHPNQHHIIDNYAAVTREHLSHMMRDKDRTAFESFKIFCDKENTINNILFIEEYSHCHKSSDAEEDLDRIYNKFLAPTAPLELCLPDRKLIIQLQSIKSSTGLGASIPPPTTPSPTSSHSPTLPTLIDDQTSSSSSSGGVISPITPTLTPLSSDSNNSLLLAQITTPPTPSSQTPTNNSSHHSVVQSINLRLIYERVYKMVRDHTVNDSLRRFYQQYQCPNTSTPSTHQQSAALAVPTGQSSNNNNNSPSHSPSSSSSPSSSPPFAPPPVFNISPNSPSSSPRPTLSPRQDRSNSSEHPLSPPLSPRISMIKPHFFKEVAKTSHPTTTITTTSNTTSKQQSNIVEGEYGVAFGFKRGACGAQCDCTAYKPEGDNGGGCLNCGHYPASHKNLGRVVEEEVPPPPPQSPLSLIDSPLPSPKRNKLDNYTYLQKIINHHYQQHHNQINNNNNNSINNSQNSIILNDNDSTSSSLPNDLLESSDSITFNNNINIDNLDQESNNLNTTDNEFEETDNSNVNNNQSNNNNNNNNAITSTTSSSSSINSTNLSTIDTERLLTNFNNWAIEDEIVYLDKLGEGTSAKVYKARWRHQEVAAKILKNTIEQRKLLDFLKELEIMVSLRSPHVVYFYGMVLQPKICMIMEYCSNQTLYHLMHTSMDFTWDWVLKFSIEMVKGINCLHNWKPVIVHRDLKSLNLLVADNWTIKVADFGLSRFATSKAQSSIRKTRGTYAYCAPEVYFGDFTVKGDIFSIGIILWELVIRCIKGKYERPFSEFKQIQYDFQILIQTSKFNLRPTIPSNCPEAFSNLILSCWEASPDKRPTASEVLDGLQALEKIYFENRKKWEKVREKFKRN